MSAGIRPLSRTEQLVAAGLLLLGDEFLDVAYGLVMRKEKSAASKESLYQLQHRWKNKAATKNFMNSLRDRIGTMSFNNEKDRGVMSDSEIMAALTKAARCETDQAKKSQILMRVADMKTKMAVAASEDEGKPVTVHYWLPFNSKCRNCELMKTQRNKTNDNNEHGNGNNKDQK